MAGKGATTREQIIDAALRMAAHVGLEGVTLGNLADRLGLSKSGLFAHFRSKEALQLSVVEEAVERFIDQVARPSIFAERGAPRVTALFENWLAWFRADTRSASGSGRGCVFLALASEYDDRPGPVREAVAASQRTWLDFVAGASQRAVDAGHFRADLDTRQFAFEFVGIGMSLQFSSKLVGDRFAERRARNAFEELVERSRRPPIATRAVARRATPRTRPTARPAGRRSATR